MMTHLFIGGLADGERIDVEEGVNFFDVKFTTKLADSDPKSQSVTHQYRRRTIETRNGSVDVFTHATPCPIEALIAGYNPP